MTGKKSSREKRRKRGRSETAMATAPMPAGGERRKRRSTESASLPVPQPQEMKCPLPSVEREKEKEVEEPSDIEEGGLDLTVSLKPVSFYIADKKEMLQQCFCVIGEKKLQRMLPDVLKVLK